MCIFVAVCVVCYNGDENVVSDDEHCFKGLSICGVSQVSHRLRIYGRKAI